MVTLIIGAMVAILLWSLVSDRLQRWHASGPVAMVLCGLVLGFFIAGDIADELNTDLAERTVELILAMILFVDATEVRGRLRTDERTLVARLLGIAFPVSLVLAVLIGIPLLGAPSLAAVVVVALVVMPIDFAPAGELLRDRRIPRALRNGLTLESGYVDAVRAPLFAVALIVIESPGEEHSVLDVLEHALPDIGYALLIGLGLGLAAGCFARASARRGWATAHGISLGTVLIPLIAYGCATGLHGNGFVAASLAGIVYKRIRVRGIGDEVLHREISLLEDIGTLSSLFMWFVFGAVTTLVLLSPFEWGWLCCALLALTLLRWVPVGVSLLGGRRTARERVLLGFLGPRGTSTIVFGLLAFNALPDAQADIVLYVMVMTVLGSVVLHGFLGRRITDWILGPSAAEQIDEPAPAPS